MRALGFVVLLCASACSSSSSENGSDAGAGIDAGPANDGGSAKNDGGSTCSGTITGAFSASFGCQVEIGVEGSKELLSLSQLESSGTKQIVILLYPSSGTLAVGSYAATDLTSPSAVQIESASSVTYVERPPQGDLQLTFTNVDPPPSVGLLPESNTHGTLDTTLTSSADAGDSAMLHVTF